MSRWDVVVLGSDLDGLVAASCLAKAGKRVVLVEPHEQLGGRARTVEVHPGFSLSPLVQGWGGLLPAVVRHLGLESRGLELSPRDGGVTTLAADGPHLHLPAGREQAQAAVERLSQRDGKGFARLSALLDRLVEFLRPLLSLQPLPFRRPSLGDLFEPAWQALRFRRLGQQDMMELLRIAPQSLKDLAEDWVDHEALRATLVLPGILGSQLGPYSPGGAANLLLWEACSFGGRLRRGGQPQGGMGAVGKVLIETARAQGVELRAGTPVARILRDGERVTGVALEGSDEPLEAEAVLSTLGPRTTFLRLLDPAASGPTLRGRLLGYRTQGAAAKVHYALEGPPPFRGEVALDGRVQVGETLDELERAYDDLKYGRISARPILDVTVPSAVDPSLAPAGKHVMSVLVQHAPYHLAEGDWSQGRETLGERVEARLAEVAPGFAERVIAREVLAPPDLEARYGLEGGHLLGGEHSLDQLFTNRPAPQCGTYRTPLTRLYLSGPATHPGGYLTGAPGYNAARRLLRDWRSLDRPEESR